MRSGIRAFHFALLAALGRTTRPGQASFHPSLLVGLGLAMTGLTILFDWIASGGTGDFQLYGLNSALALSATAIALLALFSSRSERVEETTVASALMVLIWVVAVLLTGGWQLLGVIAPNWTDALPGWIAGAAGWLWLAFVALYLAWLVGALRRIFVDWEGGPRRQPLLRAVGAVLGLCAAAYLLPTWPSFTGADFDARTANLWEALSARREAAARAAANEKPSVDRWAAVELAQPVLLERSIESMAARTPGERALYVVSLAGWSSQDVFLREATASASIVDKRFGSGARTITLANSEQTLETLPAASLQNLATTLQAIGRRMNREEDTLLLLMTSHGGRSGFALSHGSMIRRMLSPEDLKAALDLAGIKNRVVIVSACYSGSFVPVLANPNTAVFTAASADTTSFGCSNEREWTYFGDAFFNHGLREHGSLTSAFSHAKQLIGQWETRDQLPASRPQMYVGAAIAAHHPSLLGVQPDEPDRRAALR